jgi:hypothetical protein
MEKNKIIKHNLLHLTKKQLIDIAREHPMKISQSSKKEVIAEAISNILMENFIIDSDFFLLPDVYFYISVIVKYYRDSYEEELIETLEDILQRGNYQYIHEDGDPFFEKGYLVLKTDRNDQTRIIMHEPLNEDFLSNVHEIVQQAIINDKVDLYLTALTNLYGTLSMDQFLHIWNKYNPQDKIDKNRLIFFCVKMREIAIDYWYEGNFIVHHSLDDEKLDELRAMTWKKPYYTPTIEEINIYADGLFDRTAEAFQKMARFFKKNRGGLKTKATEELIYKMAAAFKFDSRPTDIFKILKSMHYNFKNDKTLAEFNDMINFSSNNTRKWVTRGATPKELFEQFERPFLKDLPKKPWK